MPVATDANSDDCSSTDRSTDGRDNELPVLDNPTVRSAEVPESRETPLGQEGLK